MSELRQCINAHGGAKKTYKVFGDAVKWAKKMNTRPTTIHKQVAYKCKKCLRFHVGRSPHNTELKHNINIYKKI